MHRASSVLTQELQSPARNCGWKVEALPLACLILCFALEAMRDGKCSDYHCASYLTIQQQLIASSLECYVSLLSQSLNSTIDLVALLLRSPMTTACQLDLGVLIHRLFPPHSICSLQYHAQKDNCMLKCH